MTAVAPEAAPADGPQPPDDGGPRRLAPILASVVALLIGGLVVVLATRSPATDRIDASPLLGKPAPDVQGTALEGGSFDLGSRRGRWVIVNFFAPWCVPCVQEHPELVSFSRRHLQAGDAEVVSVVFDDLDGTRSFFEERGGEWPVVSDPEGSIALSWAVARVPESFLVDPNGYVISRITGGIQPGQLDDLLLQAQLMASGVGAPTTVAGG